MSSLKIDQEDFNRRAQHILDTVVKPQVDRYEKAKAEKQNNMTAAEWLYERLERMIPRTALYNIDKKEYFEQAKEMEKQQIMNAHGDKKKLKSNPGNEHITYSYTYTGEMYYNDTFKKTNNKL